MNKEIHKAMEILVTELTKTETALIDSGPFNREGKKYRLTVSVEEMSEIKNKYNKEAKDDE